VVVYVVVKLDFPGGTAESDLASGFVDESFYREVWPRLVRLGRLLTGSQQVGEDLAQEAIIGLLRHPDVDSPNAYLRRSLVNLSVNHGRRTTRERLHRRTVRMDHVMPPDLDDMWPLIVALPFRQRAVLVLRYYEDLSEAEIARVLGCRPGTVKSLAARALQHLREELQT
jgi:RNA polymerase sigma factor (sigma-70 family)